MHLQINHLSQYERDEIFTSLTVRQKKFLNEELKRGRRTLFANVLAKDKAGSLADADARDVASKWEFLNYLDAGPGWQKDPQLFCECGRALRYQYIVQNSKTNEVMKFGITHFEEHTGIPPDLAKKIVKGIERIDYEIDEILIKITNNWTLEMEGIDNIPTDVEIPADIMAHFDYDVPLLDRQVVRLKDLMSRLLQTQKRQQIQAMLEEKERVRRQRKEEYAEKRRHIQEGLATQIKVDQSMALQEEYQLGIIVYLQELTDPQFLASEVCIDLVTNHGAPQSMYSSGKYEIFPNVCRFLESLTEKGILKLVEKKPDMDRIYRIVE